VAGIEGFELATATLRPDWHLVAMVATSERSRGDVSDIDGQTERLNGAFGKSDIEGNAAMVAASELGSERVSNGREHMSQRGERASLNQQRVFQECLP
jgi:hypothetical protein